MARRINRRKFLQASALAGVGFWAAGGLTRGDSKDANERLRIACIGVGGKGSSDTDDAARIGDVVALCDIDDKHLDAKANYKTKSGETPYAKAAKYHDFRKMLDEMGKNIDAVTVSTPDHTHAVAAMMAIKMKKHVYCQKPLTHTVYEARQLRLEARKNGVCTQMGNQGSAADGLRRAVELIQAGGIGKVSEAHVWTNRPIWPQAPGVTARPKPEEAPAHVHWNEFLGPAPERPYSPAYHPFAWRGWWDFGTGALGDMACHTANMAFRALDLTHPTSIQAENGEINPETYPAWARIVYQFPPRGSMPPVKFVWYEGKTKDGKNVLPAPELVKGQGERDGDYSIYFKDNKWFFRNRTIKDEKKQVKDVTSGSFLIGDKAVLFSPDDYGAESYLVTPDGVERVKGDLKKLASNNGGDTGQKIEWAKAIKENKPEIAYSNFDFAAMLTETILLGNVAMRVGKKLEWDGPELKVTNVPEAAELIKTTYRTGWTL
jgi:predicted dehydrogenase